MNHHRGIRHAIQHAAELAFLFGLGFVLMALALANAPA